MIALWGLLFAGGLLIASFASRRSVDHALRATEGSRVSAGFIGMTVMAIGTDLPEIANSVVSAVTDHGDLVVGDSAGSALTQVTLVLGILCFSTIISAQRRVVAALGSATAAALVVIGVLVGDGRFDRIDALVLIVGWLVTLFAMRHLSDEGGSASSSRGPVGRHVASTGMWLVIVAGAATLVVQSFVAITESLGIPEILAGAVILALGTSLPELIVDWTAIRRGAGALALGDLFGSSLLDATLAIGIGPAIAPTLVSPSAATMCFVAAVGVIGATCIAIAQESLNRISALLLIATYALSTVAIVVLTG